ncbi:MAG: hypothetical protein VX737_04535 [Pseudomonadota bacterium]|nr:hypothetical protein [Pseudomonadota bacterium]
MPLNTLVVVDTGYSYQDEIKAVKVIFKSSSSHLSECNFNPIQTTLLSIIEVSRPYSCPLFVTTRLDEVLVREKSKINHLLYCLFSIYIVI